MAGIRVIESGYSRLALLCGTDLFSMAGNKFHEVAIYNKSSVWPITMEVRLKGCKGLFKIPLVT